MIGTPAVSLSRLLRGGASRARRPVSAHDSDRPRTAVFTITDARTGGAHLVTEKAITAGRRTGRYLAACGTEVLAASLTAEADTFCLSCRDRVGR